MNEENFKVTISVGGRFHAFYLASQLEKRGYLGQLITSYPKFETVKYGVPRENIRSVLIKEILQRGWEKLPSFLRRSYNPQFLIHETYDKWAKRRFPKEIDIFIGWSSFSLHSLRKAKRRGAVIILERGSSHIEFQRDILKEEYEKFGLEPELTHPKIVEKELKEYEEADYIEVPSVFAKRTFLEKGIPEKKIILGFRGVDLSQFEQAPKEDNVFRVVFAGGMTLQKGVYYLLQAFSELNLPNSELILLGSKNSEIEPFFKKYNVVFADEPGKGDREIRFLGHKKQNTLNKYYSQGSVYCQNSIQDGFAQVITQAMACGLPVIATENTGGPDVVEEGKSGFIIPIRDVEALKEKLLYLYENPEVCRQIGQSAKERVSSGFSWDDYGEKIVREYKSILKEKNEK